MFYFAGENRHTGEYIAREISSVIDEVGGKKIMAVVSDNAANMRAAWTIIEQKYEYIQCYGCVAHGLHLLANDISRVESVSKILQRAKDMVKFVKYKHLPHAVFQRVQKERSKEGRPLSLLMPSATRWGTVAAMLQRLLLVQKALQYMVMEDEVAAVVRPSIRSDILDVNIFWIQVKNVHSLLQPLADAIKRVESDRPCLSDVPEIFYELQERLSQVFLHEARGPLDNKDEREIRKQLQVRKDFCTSKLQLVAHLLDPHYCGVRLTDDQMSSAYSTLCDLACKWNIDGCTAEKCMSELAEFRARTGMWQEGGIWHAAKNTPGATWWKGLCPNKALTCIASRVLSFPATSAAAERNWSTHKHIQSAKRNRLSDNRTKQLVNIAFNLKPRTRSQLQTRRLQPVQQVGSAHASDDSNDAGDSDNCIDDESDEEDEGMNSNSENDENHMMDQEAEETSTCLPHPPGRPKLLQAQFKIV